MSRHTGCVIKSAHCFQHHAGNFSTETIRTRNIQNKLIFGEKTLLKRMTHSSIWLTAKKYRSFYANIGLQSNLVLKYNIGDLLRCTTARIAISLDSALVQMFGHASPVPTFMCSFTVSPKSPTCMLLCRSVGREVKLIVDGLCVL